VNFCIFPSRIYSQTGGETTRETKAFYIGFFSGLLAGLAISIYAGFNWALSLISGG
jgi:hypothetical protein